MTVESIKAAEKSTENGVLRKADPSIFRIALSDGALFSFKSDYLPFECPRGEVCVPGRELSTAEVEALRFASACYRTERAALRLTSRAEQYSLGITRKLESRGHTAPCVRAVVACLSAADIINDIRYASRWILSRLSAAGSPRSFTASLRRRGLSRDAVQSALSAVLDEETEAAVLRSYLGKNHRHSSPRFRAAGEGRLKQFLRYEGFSPGVLERFREEGRL